MKQKQLDRIFGQNIIKFDFVSLSGKKESLRNNLEAMYQGLFGSSEKAIENQEHLEGFVITDIEDDLDNLYKGRYILPLQSQIKLEYGGDFYNISAILDLAVTLTLLMGASDTLESYTMVKDLYKQLCPGMDDKNFNLSLLLKKYDDKHKDFFRKFAIPPAAKLNYQELQYMYERIRAVLIKA